MKKLVREIAAKYEMDDTLQELEELSESIIVSIGFLGEFNAGKSTLINAILRRKLLPAMDVPTTGSITEIFPIRGLESVSFHRREGDELTDLSAVDFARIATGKMPGTAVVRVPSSASLAEDFRLVDTPGISSLDQTHADITFGYLPFLDGMVLCVDTLRGGLNQAVLRFLSSDHVQPLLGRMVVALTHGDKTGAEEVRQAVIDQLWPLLGGGVSRDLLSNRVISVEALGALEAGEGVPSFETALTDAFVTPKVALVAEREAKHVKEIARRALDALEVRLAAFSLDDPELEEKLAKCETELSLLAEQERTEKSRLATFSRQLHDALSDAGERHASALTDADEASLKDVCRAIATDLTDTTKAQLGRLPVPMDVPDTAPFVSEVRTAIGRVLRTTELAKTVTTAVVVAAATSFAGNVVEAGAGAAGKVAARTAAKGAATAVPWWRQALGKIGKTIEDINPVNHLGDYLSHLYKDQQAPALLRRIATKVADQVTTRVEVAYQDQVFDEIRKRLTDERLHLQDVKRQRREKIDLLGHQRDQTKTDIQSLRGVLRGPGMAEG